MRTDQEVVQVDDLALADVPEGAGVYRYRVRCLEVSDGTSVTIPVVVVRGASPGVAVYLGAAIHGDEIGGVHVVHEVLARLDPSRVNGTLVAVPVQNALAFQQQHRLPLGLLTKSPMDQFPGDPWMSFGDQDNGNSASLVARRLSSLIGLCDAAIDLHTPTTGGRYVQFAFLPPETAGPAYVDARKLAEAFAPDVILAETQGVYVLHGTLHVTATQRGIPSFGVEFGEGGRYDPTGVAATADGVLRAMASLGMGVIAPEAPGVPLVIKRMTAVRSTRGGLLRTQAELGTELVRGQPIATIQDVHGTVVETITAPHDGRFMRTTTFQVVNEGERVVQVGLTALENGES